MSNQSDVLLRNREVLAVVKLSRSTITAKVRDGSFPRPVRVGKRAVAWRLSDVNAWMESLTTEIAE